MSLKMKKAKDFAESGDWLVIDEDGKTVANVYFDRGSATWRDRDVPQSAHHAADFMGFNKQDVLDKVEKWRAGTAKRWSPPIGNPAPQPGRRALKMYRDFHQLEPKKISASERFEIPGEAVLAGDAVNVLYRSGKKDPTTLVKPSRPIDYIHDHEKGVKVYRTDLRDGSVRRVPDFIVNVGELVLLGQCLGFAYTDQDGEEIEAQVRTPYPELYTIPSGKALLVVQDKRRVLALIWGGRLGVEPRGIVH